jgi:cytochrome c5
VSTQDQKFFDVFMLVIGLLVAIAIGLLILARAIASDTQLQWVHSYPQAAEHVAERLKPAGRAVAAGDVAAEEPASGQVATASAPVAAPLSGPQVYNQVCMACHAQGIGGAPKIGDKTAWGSRISQGANTLHDHALKGYQGKAGVMPQKGGRVDLSDKEIVDAVDYMVSQSR